MSEVVLVYRGAAAPPDCAAAVADALRQSYQIKFVGPEDEDPVELLASGGITAYVQPGGGDDMDVAWNEVKQYAPAIKKYVEAGGAYVGICMGAYLAHKDYYGLIGYGGDTEDYVKLSGADVTTMDDYLMTLQWNDAPTQVYFQGGPAFTFPDEDVVDVVARYSNGFLAAGIINCGQGNVGLTGPHPEAPQAWYDECGFDAKECTDLFRQFVEDTIHR
eukprot:PhF_6_TR44458/c0_g1_i2/m.68435